MKKSKLLLVAALLLAGCSSTTKDGSIDTKISDDHTVIEVEGINISKQELFETFLKSYGANQILNQALQTVAEKENVDMDAVRAAVDEVFESYIAMMGGEDELAEYITSSLGYESLDQYKELALQPQQLQKQLILQYIDENYKDLIKEYGFVHVRYFTVDLESDAMSIANKISNSDMTFEEAAKENDATPTEDTLISTVYSGSKIDANVAKMATSFTTEGMYSAGIKLSDGKFAVLEVLSTDVSEDRETIDSQLTSNSDFSMGVEAHYLQKYNFEVYEQTLIEAIDKISPLYLGGE